MNKIENELLELLCEIGNPELAIRIKEKITEYRDSEVKSTLAPVSDCIPCDEYVAIHNREDEDECCKCGEKENNH